MGNTPSSDTSDASKTSGGQTFEGDPEERQEAAAAAEAAPASVTVAGGSGDRHLVVRLKDGQAILAEAGAMVHMTADLKVAAKLGGVLNALKRSAAGDSAVLSQFSGVGQVAFAPDFPCDILEVTLAPGESLDVAGGAFLAADPGVVVNGKLSLFAGLVGTGDLVTGQVANPEGNPSKLRVWLASNGAAEAHELKGSEDRLKVDNHRVLAFTPGAKTSDASLAVSGSIVGSLLGDGLVQVFEGPGTVWTQTRRSLPHLIREIAEKTKEGGGGGNSSSSGFFSSEGGGKKAGPRKKKGPAKAPAKGPAKASAKAPPKGKKGAC